MFEFSRGSFFTGQLDYNIKNFHFSMEVCNAFHAMKCFEFDITEEEMLKIGNIISPVKKWTDKYDNPSILDGYGWRINYCHNGIKIHANGYEAYPDDFRVVIEDLQDYIENLCKKYAADTYIEKEANDRRRL